MGVTVTKIFKPLFRALVFCVAFLALVLGSFQIYLDYESSTNGRGNSTLYIPSLLEKIEKDPSDAETRLHLAEMFARTGIHKRSAILYGEVYRLTGSTDSSLLQKRDKQQSLFKFWGGDRPDTLSVDFHKLSEQSPGLVTRRSRFFNQRQQNELADVPAAPPLLGRGCLRLCRSFARWRAR